MHHVLDTFLALHNVLDTFLALHSLQYSFAHSLFCLGYSSLAPTSWVLEIRFRNMYRTRLLAGIKWVFPQSVKEALINWKGPFKGKEKRKT